MSPKPLGDPDVPQRRYHELMADPKLLGSKGKKWQQAKAIIADGLSYSAKMAYKNTKTQLKSCTIKRMVHQTNEVTALSCKAYSLSLKYCSSLNP